MTDTDERFDRLEAGLDKVDGTLDRVEGRLARIEGEVQKLRVLGEENTQQLKLIVEVQSHHGSVLDQLVSDVQPLKVLPDLLRTVIQDHERRIAALEKQP